MKKTFTFMIMVFLFAAVSAQTVVVTFTGRDTSNQYVPLNRVVVSNLTKGWQETLTWPDDTVLTMTDHTGVEDAEALRATPLRLSQNTPNPFDGTTFAILQVAERGDVSLEITDITGRIVGANNYSPLRPGIHEIRITLSSAGIYFLTARQNGRISSVKIVNRSNGGGNSIAFVGGVQPKNGVKDVIDNLFEVGDQMEYVGYATIDGAEWGSDHIVQEQYVSQLVVLNFDISVDVADGMPCPSTPTVADHEGNIYNTVKIGNQCWMRENLRSTYYADGEPIPAGNSNTSYTNPYYYDSGISIPLVERGYLYNWPAVMHGASSTEANPSGVQGICPDGWHLPSNAEWSQLINYLGSVSDYCCGSNNTFVAKAMASQSGWQSSFNSCTPGYNQLLNNLSGFGAVPVSNYNGTPGRNAVFWSSSAESATSNLARCRTIDCNESIVWQGLSHKDVGISVRCLRD